MITLDSFKAALTNPSTIHKSSSLTEAFNEFKEGMKHFFKTGEVKNVRAQEREAQFTHIVQEIKYNLNTEKTGYQDKHLLYTNPNKTIKIEQRGLNIVAVCIDQRGNETHNPELLKEFKNKDDIQDFLNREPLLPAAFGDLEVHKLLLSIRYKGQAFLLHLDTIAEAHFNKTPKKNLGLADNAKDGNDLRDNMLTHLLKSKPDLLRELQELQSQRSATRTLLRVMQEAGTLMKSTEKTEKERANIRLLYMTLAKAQNILLIANLPSTAST